MAENYSKQEVIRILKNEIDTPEVVTRQMNCAFRKLGDQKERKCSRKRSFRWQAAAALMCAVIIGSVTTRAAGFFLWNQDVAEKFEADKAQQQALEAKKVTAPVEARAVGHGVTVELEQSLMTEKYMYLYFKIIVPDDMKLSGETMFENSRLLINGKDIDASYNGGILDFIEDGTDNVTYLEYFVQWADKREMSGQELTAHFENLVEVEKAEVSKKLIEGTWDVTWTIEYAPSEETFAVNQTLEGADITVKEITISPISLEVSYDWKRQWTEEPAVDEEGNDFVHRELREPSVYASQYRMKDGNLLEIDCGGMGSYGYASEDENDNTYIVSLGLTKVYTPDDIRSVIFTDRESGQTYEVPIR